MLHQASGGCCAKPFELLAVGQRTIDGLDTTVLIWLKVGACASTYVFKYCGWGKTCMFMQKSGNAQHEEIVASIASRLSKAGMRGLFQLATLHQTTDH